MCAPPNTPAPRLDVSVTDTHGKRAKLGGVQVDGLPGPDRTASYWAREVRVPLTAATRAGLDLRHVKSLELTPRSTKGKAWLMDAWGWRPGTPVVRAAALPRVDVGRTTVREGDSGVRTYRVPVRVSGHGSGQVRVYVADPVTGRTKQHLVTVHPGGHDIDVSVQVKGGTRVADAASLTALCHSDFFGSWNGSSRNAEGSTSSAMSSTSGPGISSASASA